MARRLILFSLSSLLLGASFCSALTVRGNDLVFEDKDLMNLEFVNDYSSTLIELKPSAVSNRVQIMTQGVGDVQATFFGLVTYAVVRFKGNDPRLVKQVVESYGNGKWRIRLLFPVPADFQPFPRKDIVWKVRQLAYDGAIVSERPFISPGASTVALSRVNEFLPKALAAAKTKLIREAKFCQQNGAFIECRLPLDVQLQAYGSHNYYSSGQSKVTGMPGSTVTLAASQPTYGPFSSGKLSLGFSNGLAFDAADKPTQDILRFLLSLNSGLDGKSSVTVQADRSATVLSDGHIVYDTPSVVKISWPGSDSLQVKNVRTLVPWASAVRCGSKRFTISYKGQPGAFRIKPDQSCTYDGYRAVLILDRPPTTVVLPKTSDAGNAVYCWDEQCQVLQAQVVPSGELAVMSQGGLTVLPSASGTSPVPA